LPRRLAEDKGLFHRADRFPQGTLESSCCLVNLLAKSKGLEHST
jgi:hypothetical protein